MPGLTLEPTPGKEPEPAAVIVPLGERLKIPVDDDSEGETLGIAEIGDAAGAAVTDGITAADIPSIATGVAVAGVAGVKLWCDPLLRGRLRNCNSATSTPDTATAGHKQCEAGPRSRPFARNSGVCVLCNGDGSVESDFTSETAGNRPSEIAALDKWSGF